MGCGIWDVGCETKDTGCGKKDKGYETKDTGCLMLDVGTRSDTRICGNGTG